MIPSISLVTNTIRISQCAQKESNKVVSSREKIAKAWKGLKKPIVWNPIKYRLRKFFKKLLFPTEILYHNKHIYGGLHSKNFCHLIGFQTNVFSNPYGMSFHAVAIFSLEFTTLLNSFWAHCDFLLPLTRTRPRAS